MSSETTLPSPTLCPILSSIYLPQLQKVERPPCGRPKVILLAGPTGCGKTSLALQLAKLLKVEVISADSVQVYKGMDIGTAKVSLMQRLTLPHHLIDVRGLHQRFHVADFYMEATAAIRSLLASHTLPLVVGGTGLYFHALLYGLPDTPPSIPELRHTLERECADYGLEVMYQRLQDKDPEYAATIGCGDRQKIIRALEIIMLTGGKVSLQPWRERPLLQDYDYRCWFIHRPRDALYSHVEVRCQQMLDDGLLDEVKGLIGQGLQGNSSAAHSIGYRQCLDFLASEQKEEDYVRFVAQFKQASRRYIKRQLTWFRAEPSFCWLDVDEIGLAKAAHIIAEDYTGS